jgi:2,3-bisphosphoglycerate-dependent phosphoglycerate mutase
VPSGTTHIALIRHGETAWNIEHRMQGQEDSPLTALGLRQAECLGQRLADEPIDRLYSSDLPRAYNTAREIGDPHRLEPLVDAALRERHFGVFQGLTVDEIRREFPDEFARHISGDPDFVIPEGESRRQFWERSVDALERIREACRGQRVVVVLHGGVLNILVKHVLGMPIGTSTPFTLFNAAINRVRYDGDGWKLVTLGDVHHLEEVTSFQANVY